MKYFNGDFKMKRKIKKTANKIIRDYFKGAYDREKALEMLEVLNAVGFAMIDFRLVSFNPGEIQDYIHALQAKI